jgi:hypothetical protein
MQRLELSSVGGSAAGMSAVRVSISVQEVADMAGKRDKAWSVAGAARSGREARIATVRHLRDAPIARLWQMTRLQAAYQLHASHVGHPAAARLVLFGGMGYRPPYPADWQAAADLIVGDEAGYLSQADLYILTPRDVRRGHRGGPVADRGRPGTAERG